MCLFFKKIDISHLVMNLAECVISVLRLFFEFDRTFAKMFKFKAVFLVGFIIKSIEFINCRFVEFIEIFLPFITCSKFGRKKCIGNIATQTSA